MKNAEHTATILIVDDDRQICDQLSLYIKKSGYRCLWATSPYEALDIIADMPVDVAVVDLMMPGMNGIELTHLIKERYPVDVIIMSAYLEDRTYKDVVGQGASDFIEKPIKLSELMARLNNLLDLRSKKYSKNTIVKAIEFPPEYFQAGISILNLFGSVLNKKHPDQKAKISIEQEGLKVRLVIDPVDGDKEVLEKALADYGLVVRGKMSPEEYTDDKMLILELKTELRFAQARVESQRELIEYQNADVADLKKLLEQALLAKPTDFKVNVPVTVSAHSTVNQAMDFAPSIQMMRDSLSELNKQSQGDSGERNKIGDIIEATAQLDKCKSKDEIRKSPALTKIKKFIEDIEKAESWAYKIVKTAENGVEIGRKVAKGYNALAQLCGLPVISIGF